MFFGRERGDCKIQVKLEVRIQSSPHKHCGLLPSSHSPVRHFAERSHLVALRTFVPFDGLVRRCLREVRASPLCLFHLARCFQSACVGWAAACPLTSRAQSCPLPLTPRTSFQTSARLLLPCSEPLSDIQGLLNMPTAHLPDISCTSASLRLVPRQSHPRLLAVPSNPDPLSWVCPRITPAAHFCV